MTTQPQHGTSRRYRLGCRCEACKAAHSRAQRLYRARRRQAGDNPLLQVVTETPAEPMPMPAAVGDVERAVADDLAELDTAGPMDRTLRAMALSLAREIDQADSKTSKAALHNQLLDVVQRLRGDSDDSEPAGDDILAALSAPLVLVPPT